MRKHSQNGKQTKSPSKAKKKILQLAHLANSFVKGGMQGRLGEVYPEASSAVPDAQGWSIRAMGSVSARSEPSL